MIKHTAAALALVLTAACASTPMTSSLQSVGARSGAVLTANVKDAPDYILLSAPNQIRSWDFGSNSVRALHVRGTMTNRGFIAIGDVQGNGKFCSAGQDWLSLSEIKVYKAGSGKTPRAPYVLGCATSSGFQPASRAIVTE